MSFSLQGYEAIYDISILLGGEQIDLPIPGVPPFSRERILTFEGGGGCELSKLVLTPHAGTHVDAPSHFVPKGKSIDEYSMNHYNDKNIPPSLLGVPISNLALVGCIDRELPLLCALFADILPLRRFFPWRIDN